jgi:hypothetical protein
VTTAGGMAPRAAGLRRRNLEEEMARWSRARLLTVPVTVLTAVAVVAPSAWAAVPGWRIQSTVPASARQFSIVYGIASVARANSWAVGDTTTRGRGATPFVRHWNGSSWRTVTLPGSVMSMIGKHAGLTSVGATSPGNVWIFTASGAWVRYDGKAWTAGKLPQGPIPIWASLVFSHSDVWAMGGGYSEPYAAHFDGSKWTVSSPPGQGGVTAASAVTPGDIWAVEGESAGEAFITGGVADPPGLEHYSGGTWQKVKLPKTIRRALGAVYATSDHSVWVGGAKTAGEGTTEIVGHYDGSSWTVGKLPASRGNGFYAVSALVTDGHGGLWASGANPLGNVTIADNRIWHFAKGRWTRSPIATRSPILMLAMARVPGTSSVWGAGAVARPRSIPGMLALYGPIPR